MYVCLFLLYLFSLSVLELMFFESAPSHRSTSPLCSSILFSLISSFQSVAFLLPLFHLYPLFPSFPYSVHPLSCFDVTPVASGQHCNLCSYYQVLLIISLSLSLLLGLARPQCFVRQLDGFILWLQEALDSTENWTQPRQEVDSLRVYLDTHLVSCMQAHTCQDPLRTPH